MAAPNWANQTIWTADNLDVLRGMNSASVDLVYLDPPFNSNRDYAAPIGSEAAGAAFKDTWTLSDLDEAWHNEIADRDLPLYKAIEASSYTHGDGMKSYLIMMALRLIELRRVLKETGSIYLHCDPTASHYLKVLLDAIFGVSNFRNEITWQRTESHNTADRYGNIADVLLFYVNGLDPTWNGGTHTYASGHKFSDAQMKRFRHDDGDGRRYRLDDLTAPRPDSDSGKFTWRGTTPSAARGWGYRLEQLEAWWEEGRIRTKRDGTPRMDGLKVYLDEAEGKALQNIWADVPRISNTSAERTGYPTQKPLALLERIITASSNPGDVVLDPFCGCATACVAAEKLGREWVGIDISSKASELVGVRMRQLYDRPMLPFAVTHRTDVPRRTDLAPAPPIHESRVRLYGEQGGHCNGCGTHFEPQHLTVDHIIPVARAGTDHLWNLQLLCGHCNSVKGDRPMEYLRMRLARSAA